MATSETMTVTLFKLCSCAGVENKNKSSRMFQKYINLFQGTADMHIFYGYANGNSKKASHIFQ
jgi:hypothetical protein